MKRRRLWTPAAIARLIRDYADTPTWKIARAVKRPLGYVYAKAARLGLKKSAAYLASPAACRLRRGDNVGAAYRFPKGHIPFNKGMKGWQAGGRSVATQFKPGHASTWDPDIYCIGGLRINSDGQLDIKLRNGARGWDSMARWIWQTERGPIPKGMVVRFRNGDNHDPRIENLRLATRREVMLENTIHHLPKELASSIQLLGALRRQINRRSRKNDRSRKTQNPRRPARAPVRHDGRAPQQRKAHGTRSRQSRRRDRADHHQLGES